MTKSFKNSEGGKIVYGLIGTIQENKQYLSDIDGAIGDGDHGINMNKGFTLCGQELDRNPGDLEHCLRVLSKVLIQDIGGSMGPLYGMFFQSMADACKGRETINAGTLGEMLKAGEEGVREIGVAEVGDKTMLDTLVPAVRAFVESNEKGAAFEEALEEMREAAIRGRDSTRNMIARVGRASRLGERSRGVIDAGSASCCLILLSIADSVESMLEDTYEL
ncbi:MAG TPA: dihydroxyacetone kinase subunit DhaL [Anaerovoracaceae bacterium]|nr:dihydroxyacetone kinase subunit DhaL [Anaerovoracaceae bacterium]